MARFDKLNVLSTMVARPVIPVFYHADIDVAKHVVKACYDGGVRAFEFTNRGDYAHEVFGELNRWASRECPELMLGAGTVVDAPTAALYMQLGANFIVGPMFDAEVARLCHRRGVAYIPGCDSISLVSQAMASGCDIIKVFPGEVLGTGFVKALRAPMPWAKLMVTGGVEPTRESLTAWMEAGATCVGMGSKLFPKDKVAAADWTFITQKCSDLFACIDALRSEGEPLK